MCLPAAALPVLAIASSAVSAAGQLYGGMQQNAQAKYESKIARQNAALSRESAEQSLKQGQSEKRKFWREVGQIKGQQIASMAANGIDVDFGAGARLQDDTQMLANEDASNLYENISNRTKGYVIEAANYRTQSKAVKRQGKAALIGSVFGAAGSILGGVQQAAGMRAKFGTSYAGAG